MPKYIAIKDTWLSHECRMAKAGDKFETEFPKANGKPMRLGENLKLDNSKADKADDAPPEDVAPDAPLV